MPLLSPLPFLLEHDSLVCADILRTPRTANPLTFYASRQLTSLHVFWADPLLGLPSPAPTLSCAYPLLHLPSSMPKGGFDHSAADVRAAGGFLEAPADVRGMHRH